MTAREPDDIDARFDEIMSHWDSEADLTDRALPDPDLSGREQSAGRARPGEPPARPSHVNPPLVHRDPASGLSMGTDHRSYTPPDDPDDEEFVPSPPAPMPSMDRDPAWWAILTGLVGGPLVLLVLTLSGHTSPRLWLWLAGLATAAGFVGLVLRLPRSRDDDDDGARV